MPSTAASSVGRHPRAELRGVTSKAGDYLALFAYVEMNDVHEELLQRVRHMVRDRKRVATCLGFGPRFLHSTGQAYKGGPNSGVVLQITCDDAEDLAVPGQKSHPSGCDRTGLGVNRFRISRLDE